MGTREPGVRKALVQRTHHSGEDVEIPVAYIRGRPPGPTFAVVAGMHAGEYA